MCLRPLLLLTFAALLAACGDGGSGGSREQVEAAQRDETTVVIEKPTSVYGPEVWKVSVNSECASYDGDDKELVESDRPTLLEGLVP